MPRSVITTNLGDGVNPALFNPYRGMNTAQLREMLATERSDLEQARKDSSEAGKVQRTHERAIALINEAIAANVAE